MLVQQLRRELALVEAEILAVPFRCDLQTGPMPGDRIAALAAED